MNVGFSPLATGRLFIAEHGVVESDAGRVARVPGSVGLATIGADSSWVLHDSLYVGGDEIGIGGLGTLTLDGGTLEAAGIIQIWPTGRLDGTGKVTGNVFNAGLIAPGAPTGSLRLDEVHFETGSIFAVQIGGLQGGIDYDQLLVNHTATLGGHLTVELINSARPASAETFTILAANALAGQWDNVADGARFDTLGGEGSFLVSYDSLSSAVVLSDFTDALLAGDYNNNRVVDAADYAVWRDNLGTENVLPNDPIAGAIGHAQYAQWKSNYGTTVGTPISVAAVPEPTAIFLLVFAAAAIASWPLHNSATAELAQGSE